MIDKKCDVCGGASTVWVEVNGKTVCAHPECHAEAAKPPKRSLNLGRPAGAPKPPGVG